MVRNKVALKLLETLKDLGIERAGLHALRHMAASELIQNGVAPSVVQRQMRHSDSRITLQKYAHVIGDAQLAGSGRTCQPRFGANPLIWS